MWKTNRNFKRWIKKKDKKSTLTELRTMNTILLDFLIHLFEQNQTKKKIFFASEFRLNYLLRLKIKKNKLFWYCIFKTTNNNIIKHINRKRIFHFVFLSFFIYSLTMNLMRFPIDCKRLSKWKKMGGISFEIIPMRKNTSLQKQTEEINCKYL